MIPINKLEMGIANYLDAELMPQLGSNGFEKFMAGTVISIVIRRSGQVIESFKTNKWVQRLGIMDDKGNIDAEILMEEMKKNIPDEGFSVDVPMVGNLKFHKEDVDKLADYIMV